MAATRCILAVCVQLLRMVAATSSPKSTPAPTTTSGPTSFPCQPGAFTPLTITQATELPHLATCSYFYGTITMQLSEATAGSYHVSQTWSLPITTLEGNLIITQETAADPVPYIVDITDLVNVNNLSVQNVNPVYIDEFTQDGLTLNMGTMLADYVYFNNVTFAIDTFPFDDSVDLTILDSFEAIDTNLATISVSQSNQTWQAQYPFFVTMQNNQLLNNITLQLGQSATITLSDNGDQCVADLGAVETAGLRISGVQSLVADSLHEISYWDPLSGALAYEASILSNNTFTQLPFANLAEIDRENGATLMIMDNSDLTSIDFDYLTQAYGLVISGNPRLSQVDFPLLQTVPVTLSLSGPLTSVALPSVTVSRYRDYIPSITIDSSANMKCDANLMKLRKAGDVAGNFRCGGLRGLSTDAKAGIGVGVGVGVLLLIGALFFGWRYRRARKTKANAIDEEKEQDSFFKSELEGRAVSEAPDKRNELGNEAVFEAPAESVELPAFDQRHELLSEHGTSEA